MMINIDLSAATFYESGPLINIVKFLGRSDDLRRGINDKEHVKLEEEKSHNSCYSSC